MRILHINKFVYPKGGAEVYMLRTAAEQSKLGHEVAIFGARGASTQDLDIRVYNYDIADFHDVPTTQKPRVAGEVLWSNRAAAALGDVITTFRPEIIHLHNYAHQMSSSILDLAANRGVPVAHTAHDYKLICPAYVANVRGSDCFACSYRIAPKLLTARCHHGSLSWSALAGIEAQLVRKKKLVPKTIIAPSKFMATQLSESWLGKESHIELLRNPAQASGLTWEGGDRLLYVGRLSREKGLHSLIKAAFETKRPLDIAGAGPLREELERLAKDFSADVKFHGHIGTTRLQELRKFCAAQVIPSEWPENAPLSALEAIVDGVPIIASPRGGMPEYEALGARIQYAESINAENLELALQKVQRIEPNLTSLRQTLGWDEHISRLCTIYDRAC